MEDILVAEEPLQPISEEELNFIKEDLLKAISAEKIDTNKALSLIKLIRTKKITLALLQATKIGKVFTKITMMKVDEAALIENAKNLLNIWKEMNRKNSE